MADDVLAELESLYRAGHATYVRVALAVTGDREAARDAVHDAFVLAVRQRRRFRGSGPLEGWLWRIVVNEARKRGARERRWATLGEEARRDRAETNGHAEHGRLAALVAALPERQRLALFLRYYADLPYVAIAEALGIAPGTVAATLNAAHSTLRRQLQEVDRCEI